MFLLTLNDKLFLAPLDQNPPKKALDIGTGTGIWAQYCYPDVRPQLSSLSVLETLQTVSHKQTL